MKKEYLALAGNDKGKFLIRVVNCPLNTAGTQPHYCVAEPVVDGKLNGNGVHCLHFDVSSKLEKVDYICPGVGATKIFCCYPDPHPGATFIDKIKAVFS
jgi:hypothetical protein